MFLKWDSTIILTSSLIHLIVYFLIFHHAFAQRNSDNNYGRKYLDSFPLDEKNHSSNAYFHNNFLMSNHETRKYKKVRKKPPTRNQTLTEEDEGHKQYDEEEKYYVGFTRNPFGPSSPISEISEFPLNISDKHQFRENRDKRGVAQLYNMVACATGCNPISYKGYGCYCGFLGSGRVTDSIDRCCKLHDLCYNAVNCPLFFHYFMPYLWKCWRGQPLCAVDHLDYGGPNSCAARLCECDRQLAVCLSYSPCPVRRALCTSSPWRLLQNILMF